MRARPLETVADAVAEAIDDGLTPEGATRRVMRLLSDGDLKVLARGYVLEIAYDTVRLREYAERRRAVVAVRPPAPQRHVRSDAEIEEETRAHEAIDARYRAKMDEIAEKFAAELRVEWTAELLASTFGTPNGRVTWADATVEDHRAHIEMDLSAMEGYAADAALHKKAISDITAANAGCLSEIREVAA